MITEMSFQIEKLRSTKPVVLCLTNYVTMDFTANSLLALGAAPIMCHEGSELEELIEISQALYINIGTLDMYTLKIFHDAVSLAKKQKKPIVLDPVGSGASKVRTNASRSLLTFSNVVRGNASEILSLVNPNEKTLGVESLKKTQDATLSAIKLAKTFQGIVLVSGEEDFVTDGEMEISLKFGSHLMPYITGMGCALTAVIAAFCAINNDFFEASTIATAYFGLCGNIANQKTNHPGTFRAHFIDALYAADFEEMNMLMLREA